MESERLVQTQCHPGRDSSSCYTLRQSPMPRAARADVAPKSSSCTADHAGEDMKKLLAMLRAVPGALLRLAKRWAAPGAGPKIFAG